MFLEEIKISLSGQDAVDLQSLIKDFFSMQAELKRGEESSRMILAKRLLEVLPTTKD